MTEVFTQQEVLSLLMLVQKVVDYRSDNQFDNYEFLKDLILSKLSFVRYVSSVTSCPDSYEDYDEVEFEYSELRVIFEILDSYIENAYEESEWDFCIYKCFGEETAKAFIKLQKAVGDICE